VKQVETTEWFNLNSPGLISFIVTIQVGVLKNNEEKVAADYSKPIAFHGVAIAQFTD
jgi:hypothetical protein